MKIKRIPKIVAKTILITAILGTMVTLTGCGALSTSISHKDLKVQTKKSNTIFLPPISDKIK